MEYWISIKGQKQGPLREWDVRDMIEEQQLTENDLIWHSSLPMWEKLGDYTAFKSYFQPAAPEPAEDEEQSDAATREEEIENVKAQLQAKIEEVTGKPLPADSIIRVERVESHYWVRRGFAKGLDFVIYTGIFFMVANFMGLPFGVDPSLGWVNLIQLIPFIVLEGFMLYLWGVTPGKLVLGLRVQPLSGMPALGYNRAFFRSAASWFFGMAMGVFPFFIIAMIMSYFTTKARGLSTWDAVGRTRVQAVHNVGVVSILSYIALFLVLMICCGVFVTSHEPTALAMGELMLEQFKDFPNMQEQIREQYQLPASAPPSTPDTP